MPYTPPSYGFGEGAGAPSGASPPRPPWNAYSQPPPIPSQPAFSLGGGGGGGMRGPRGGFMGPSMSRGAGFASGRGALSSTYAFGYQLGKKYAQANKVKGTGRSNLKWVR